ncbi:hypothetical protein QBC34DRAFT_474510 [Podospora aff. communis PSN243]|uniref:Heterokaryon incompatibility domain-containing protein n=1 Tax=Podospora aff. communis PSN243 TaxID=3040156 RepID=A0AAV9G7L0_9PEZI|nr:hypothetical protein QBC34DRAFT_474510 [Podospora aff. communis PSN243]
MHWECYSLKESEDGLTIIRDTKLPEFEGEKVLTYAKNAGIFSLRATVRGYEMLKFQYPGSHDDHWDNVMQDYTARRLTYKSDKVPALAGITQMFQSVKKDLPLLGMWKLSLPRNLIWQVEQFSVRSGALPSWTFLSVDDVPVVTKPSWADDGRTGPFEADDIEVIEATVAWKGPAMTSRFASSTLRVKAKLCQARLDSAFAEPRKEPNVFRIIPFDPDKKKDFGDSFGRSLGECWLDSEPVGEEETVWLLKLGRIAVSGGRSERISMKGYKAGVLVLRRAAGGGDDVFRRIGAGFLWWKRDGDGGKCFGEEGVQVRCVELV